MSNMSYCRFRNTVEDLYDCQETLDDWDFGELSKGEIEAAMRLVRMCKRIAAMDEECELLDALQEFSGR